MCDRRLSGVRITTSAEAGNFHSALLVAGIDRGASATATAEALREIIDLDLDTLTHVRPPRDLAGLNQNEVGKFCPMILENFSRPLTGPVDGIFGPLTARQSATSTTR